MFQFPSYYWQEREEMGSGRIERPIGIGPAEVYENDDCFNCTHMYTPQCKLYMQFIKDHQSGRGGMPIHSACEDFVFDDLLQEFVD